MGSMAKKQRQRIAHLVSLGCAKNLVDSELMLGSLAQAGYAVSASPDGADVVVVNTCGFIRAAETEAEDVIAAMAELKRQNVFGTLVVAGCLAERRRAALRERFPEIDVLAGTSAAADIAQLLESNDAAHFPPRAALPDHTRARLPSTPPWMAYLRTAEGCSNRCAYCVIPMLRGGFRSRAPESLEHEARDLVRLGARELVLIAQDNTRYGRDLKPPSSLSELLRRLDRIRDLRWIRVMYCHPARTGDALLETMAACEKVLPYLDIPVQHAHPDILRAMNRPADPDAILRTLGRARELMPGICIRTTVMAGFPGETEKHFNALLEFIKTAQFDRLGAFMYSPEPEAPAAMMPGQVPEPVKGERLERIMEIQKDISLKKNLAWVGRELEVLVEEPAPAPGMMRGRSFREAPDDIDGSVFVPGRAKPGAFKTVRVRSATAYDLFAEEERHA